MSAFRLVVLIPEQCDETMTLACARIIAKPRRGRMEVLRNRSPSRETSSEHGGDRTVCIPDFDAFIRTAEQWAGGNGAPASLLVVAWTAKQNQLQALLSLIVRLNLPAVIVNWTPEQEVKRILFPSSGGLHTVPQVWVVSELAKALQLPVQLLCVVHSAMDANGETDVGVVDADDAMTTRLQLSMLGLRIPVETECAGTVVDGVRTALTAGDMVVLGGPNYGQTVRHFRGSIPDLLIRDRRHPTLMLLTGKPVQFPLENVFWNETIRIDLHPRSREDLIEQLVDVLVDERQLPRIWRNNVLAKALKREQILPTAVGCETAFPHVTIPGYSGIIGCCGICPDGVNFGDPSLPPVRFVFLMVTPGEDYQDYLAIIAQLARRMSRESVRTSILKCRTPGEVQKILTQGFSRT